MVRQTGRPSSRVPCSFAIALASAPSSAGPEDRVPSGSSRHRVDVVVIIVVRHGSLSFGSGAASVRHSGGSTLLTPALVRRPEPRDSWQLAREVPGCPEA